jgi:exodeoxyribonuclease V gamma subunit
VTAGLTLHTSNRLEILADQLAQLLSDTPASPFTPETVVVQSHGMRRWLAQELAQRLDICANVEFPFPQNFFRRLLETIFPEAEASLRYEREMMTWRVMQLLPALMRKKEFAAVARYLEGEKRERRAFQLAQKIAGVFDQYLVFRPALIARWDTGADAENWQAILWREFSGKPAHQVAEAQRLTDAIRQKNIPQLPRRLGIFGISTLPPFYLSLFEEIAAVLPVHLFLMEPTPEWWGDIRSQRERARMKQPELFDFDKSEAEESNPLLAANAKQGRDFLNLVFDLNANEQTSFLAPAADTVLHQIQRDIFELRDPATKRVVAAGDRSLQMHACHSPRRELEILHDQLLALFERDPSLKPKDVVVMMPEVAIYAPFIDAVFAVSENPALVIPYTIADRSARAASGAIDTFLRALEILPGRFGVTEVLALLESPAVQRKFKIESADLEVVRGWLEACAIRWGIDAEHRAQFHLPRFADNTWRHGLDRMLLGSALMPKDRELFHGILPFDEIEGSSTEVLGQLVEFLERLFALARDFPRPRSLRDWQDDLSVALENLLEPDETTALELVQLRAAIARLGAIAEHSGNDDAAPLDIIIAQLESLLNESAGAAGFLSGGVTFCALKPMRSIPFRVVCLLGLNDTAYPRHDPPPGCELIAQNPQRGDRNTRDDDRALFLEAILSARDVFYISYLGRSLRDNAELPPSVLVSELLDYLEKSFAHADRPFVVTHPLQAFSPRYFAGDDRLFSYSEDNCAAGCVAGRDRLLAPVFLSEPLAEATDEWRDVDLTQLISFFAHPVKFFLRERLRIQLPRDETELEDREPFALGPLDRYDIEQELLRDTLDGAESECTLAAMRAEGILPPGQSGAQNFDEFSANARAFVDAMGAHATAKAEEPLEVMEKIGRFNFSARIEDVRGGVLLQYRLAKLKGKDFTALWLKHLARNLIAPGTAVLFGGNDAVESYEFSAVTNAREVLTQLLEIYWRGLHEPLRFFPRSSWMFVEQLGKAGDPAEARELALRKAWFGSRESRDADSKDAFIDLVFRDVEEPLNAEWERLARDIFDPLFAHRSSR